VIDVLVRGKGLVVNKSVVRRALRVAIPLALALLAWIGFKFVEDALERRWEPV
jgi:hypothetical protein